MNKIINPNTNNYSYYNNQTTRKYNKNKDKPARNPHHWSHQEDILLQNQIEHLNLLNRKEDASYWTEIASGVPGRSSKQCRERYKFNLDPEIKKEPFTTLEDELILRKQAKHGNKWALISQDLKGRTENAVKTRYKSIVKQQQNAWRIEEDQYILYEIDKALAKKKKKQI